MKPSTERSGSPGVPRWLGGDEEPKRPPLNRRRIVEAAVALADHEGFQALTIRRIAGELGVSPMSIYSHVADKAELIDLFVDQVVGEARVDVDPDVDWIENLRSVCRGYRESWDRHPGATQAYSAAAGNPSPTSIGPNAMAQAEQVLGVLAGAGFSTKGQAQAFKALHVFLRGAMAAQPNRLQALSRPVDDGPTVSVDEPEGIGRFIGSTDPASVPHFIAAAPYMAEDGFEFMLDALLSGLAAKLALES